MSPRLVPCPACSRHVRADVAACPFCEERGPFETASLPARALVSRGALLALGALAAVACSSGTSSDGSIAQPYGAPPIPQPDIAGDWTLSANKTLFAMKDVASFRLEMSVTNDTGAPIDPKRSELSFHVNDAPSQVLDLAFQNGAMDASWSSLAPGASAKDAREPGASLFQAPGAYRIDLRHGGVTVATVSVQIDP